MKEEALKLADELDALRQYVPSEAPAMIRRLVEELDKQWYMVNKDGYVKPLSDDEIKAIENFVKYSELSLSNDEYMLKFARAIEGRHGIK